MATTTLKPSKSVHEYVNVFKTRDHHFYAEITRGVKAVKLAKKNNTVKNKKDETSANVSMKGNINERSVNEDHTPVLALGEFTGSLDTDEWLSRSTMGVLKDIQLIFSIQ